MTQARFAQNQGRSALRKSTSLLEMVRGGTTAVAIEPGPVAPSALGGVLGAALEADAASKQTDVPADEPPSEPDGQR